MLDLLLGLLGLIAIIIALGFVLPDRVRMSREIVINAPREKVFAHVRDFQKWEAWSPWAKLDTNTQYTYEGNGVGHKMAWASEKRDVGRGTQVITEIGAPRKMVSKLTFEGMGSATAAFKLSEIGDSETKIVWSFDTNMREDIAIHMKPMATYIGMFMMKGALGKQFEDGLQSLKSIVES